MRLSKNTFTNKKHDLSEHEFRLGACKYGHHMNVLDQKGWSRHQGFFSHREGALGMHGNESCFSFSPHAAETLYWEQCPPVKTRTERLVHSKFWPYRQKHESWTWLERHSQQALARGRPSIWTNWWVPKPVIFRWWAGSWTEGPILV